MTFSWPVSGVLQQQLITAAATTSEFDDVFTLTTTKLRAMDSVPTAIWLLE